MVRNYHNSKRGFGVTRSCVAAYDKQLPARQATSLDDHISLRVCIRW